MPKLTTERTQRTQSFNLKTGSGKNKFFLCELCVLRGKKNYDTPSPAESNYY